MALCSTCRSVVSSLYSGQASWPRSTDKVEQWYRIQAPTNCKLCLTMRHQIRGELLEYVEHDDVKIRFNASPSLLRGWIHDTLAFSFLVKTRQMNDYSRVSAALACRFADLLMAKDL